LEKQLRRLPNEPAQLFRRSVALVSLGLGDKEAAIGALERAYRNGEAADI
jgi:hypothetical protein